MKTLPIYAALICAGLMATPSHLSGQPVPPAATSPLGPRMTFVTNEYHFGKVIAGEKVKYIFILTNTGDQTLVISNVAPGCHCTTVGDWTKAHQIEPGQTGEIPIQFDSGVFRGDVHKSIMVTSNDKLEPRKTLMLSGTIWQAFVVSPQTARIEVSPDATSNATSVVHITSQADEMITLSNPISATANFKAELQTIKPGKEFDVTISALPPFAPGNTVGTISVNTSLTNVPLVNITVIAVMQPAVVVSPLQIILSPQIVVWTTNVIRITAKGNNALALSDLEVSDTNITVALKEITPGREFQLVAAFPPGYHTPAGQQVRLSVKSNNAQFPMITVPITQFPLRPAMSPPLARPRALSPNPPPLQATGHP